MDRYQILCTEEQTKKALELGAPIKIEDTRDKYSFLPQYLDSTGCRTKKFEDAYKNCYCDETAAYLIPTAEQMIGWLEEQYINEIYVEQVANQKWAYLIYDKKDKCIDELYGYTSRQEATIAAIDAALDYLINAKEE